MEAHEIIGEIVRDGMYVSLWCESDGRHGCRSRNLGEWQGGALIRRFGRETTMTQIVERENCPYCRRNDGIRIVRAWIGEPYQYGRYVRQRSDSTSENAPISTKRP